MNGRPRQVTSAPHGHVLTNAAVWSADSRWIVYDVRSDPAGSRFDGTAIERVDVDTGRVERLYTATGGACCGVVTASPVDDRVVFIHGPERPTPDWSYGPARRQGVVVRGAAPGRAEALDARDLVPPFTPGALRGGTHVHVFSPDGALVSFTYEDAVLPERPPPGGEGNLRAVGVAVCGRPVTVPRTHVRNHDGNAWSVLVTTLADAPRPGSDEISRAYEEAWVGSRGYRRADGSWQRYALAFQGQVRSAAGEPFAEAFLVDLPDDPAAWAMAGARALCGTATTRPAPPRSATQRRLTFTADRRYPGIQGPRHWLRSSPDGERIGLLMKDDAGIDQLWTVSPRGELTQLSRSPAPIASAFSWSPSGAAVACIVDGSVCLVDAADGRVRGLTEPIRGTGAPRPEACVFSPDGRRIAFVRTVPTPLPGGARRDCNQIFVVDVD